MPITRDCFETQVDQGDARLVVIGMSGCGKTYFETEFQKDEPDWETFSVDGEIKRQLSGPVTSLIRETLDAVDWSLGAEAAVQRLRSAEFMTQAVDLIRQGVENFEDPEDLSWQTYWQQASPENADAHAASEVLVLNHLGRRQFQKNVYISTPGSVVNAPSETLDRLTQKACTVYIDLDTPELIGQAIDQMAGKPISITPRQAAAKGRLSDYEFAAWLVLDRDEQYRELADIVLRRSELEGANSTDFLDQIRAQL